MTLKQKIFSIIGILALLGGGYWWRASRSEVIIPTETVTRGAVSETISVTGEVVPEQYADLAFRSIGLLENVWVTEGERVQKGDPLMRLDRGALLSQLRSLEVALAITEENERLARRDWSSLAPEEREAKVLATEKARAEVSVVREQLMERVLRAPFDGIATKVLGRSGETVGAGEIVLRLVGSNAEGYIPLKIEGQIPESDVTKVKVGMPGKITFDALTNDEVFDVVVREIEPSATVVQDVVSYTGTFSFSQKPDERLRDGMTVNIDIETAKREGVLILPFRSIVREDGKYFVEVEENNAFVRRTVKIGLEGDEGDVEILDGVREYDRVKMSTKSE